MAITTIVSDSADIIVFGVGRDASKYPYVCFLDTDNKLKVVKANTVNPSQDSDWATTAQVGDGNVYNERKTGAYFLIYTHGGTEYLGVFRINDSLDLVFDRATVSGFSSSSFDSGDTVTVDTTVADWRSIAADYGDGKLIVIWPYATTTASIRYSTDGGGSWTASRIDCWTGTTIDSSSIAWNGSHFHLITGRGGGDAQGYTKRWSSSGGLEHWTGSAWTSSSSTDAGYDSGANYFRDRILFGRATANIIVFGGSGYGDSKANIIYSTTDGEGWTKVGSMGYQNWGGFPGFMIKTETGEVDDVFFFASNYDDPTGAHSNTGRRVYDYSASSEGSWVEITQYGASDKCFYFASTLLQVGDGLGFVYRHFDYSETAYYLRFNNYEETSGATEYTKTYSADVLLAALGQTQTYSAELLLKALGLTQTYQADLLLKALDLTQTYSADLLLKGVDLLKTYEADVLLKILDLTKTYEADVLLQALDQTKTYTADVLLVLAQLKTYSADLLLKASDLTKTYSSDVLLKALDQTKTYSADLLLVLAQLKTYEADVVLKAVGLTKTYSADVLLKALGQLKTYTADVLLQMGDLTKTYTADVILTILYQAYTKTYQADVLLRATLIATYQADVILGTAGITYTQNNPLFTRDANIYSLNDPIFTRRN